MVPYGYERKISLSIDSVLEKLPLLLEQDGFIVVSSLDISLMIKEMLGIDFQRYQIIGVVNPPNLLSALTTEESIGLLYPNNIVVYQKADSGVIAAIIKTTIVMKLSENNNLREIAYFIESKLKMVIDAL
jgi:uncharacterized protein (DUF302 family)